MPIKAKEYYFDRVRIITPYYVQDLKKILPMKELKEETGSYPIIRDLRHPWHYKSAMEIHLPSKRCLELLAQIDKIISPYKISYIELARDTYYSTGTEAVLAALHSSKTLIKKYSGTLTYDGSEKEKNIQKGLFADRTNYYGSVSKKSKIEKILITGKFGFTMYPKDSPLNNLPCFHSEWEIQSANIIFKKTGIKTIRDLLEINKAEVFKQIEAKYIIHRTINRTKLGMWLLGWKKCKKLPPRRKTKAWVQGQMFCDYYHIRTAAELVTIFKYKKMKIKSKVGRKSEGEQRILALNCAQFF